MAVQHQLIADNKRHEAKGASTATNGQVLKANGDGTTTFVAPNSLSNISVASTLEASSLVSQAPAAVDTPYQITFGSGSSNTDAAVASNGNITINTSGLYYITFNLNLGRTNATGIAIVFARLYLNGSPIDIVQSAKIDTSINVVPLNYAILRSLSATDVLKIEIIRDSSGTNDGGLITLDPVLAGWSNSPSAFVRVQKIQGGA